MKQRPIAIVGMGGLFPGSLDVGQFWNNILRGADLVTDVPATHWRASDYLDKDPKAPDKTYCARGAFLPPVPFDPMKEGIPPSLLPSTDTSQLLGLLVARSALEDALGPLEKADRSRVSCILGVTSGQELFGQMASRLRHPEWRAGMRAAGIEEELVDAAVKKIGDAMVPWTEATFPGLLGNVVAGRIANRLDLGGTNAVTDAACASSFAAISMGVDELVLGRADVVLSGGVDTLNDIFMYMCFSKTPALSASGQCRPFDASADGTLLGEGLGMLALKRLDDAERDGNKIYAVIRGVGTSSDGRSKSVYAPVSEGQAKALARAYDAAGFSPHTVELVEAHGTGTRAGDVAEIGGLKIAFAGAQTQSCAVGSVKSQIGHTKSAAGAAGLMKAALALHEKIIPPTIKVTSPNPGAEFDKSPFYLPSQARPWIRSSSHPRRAGVSSFGFGGSNFHVVLEEYVPQRGGLPRPPSVRFSRRDVEVYALSAPTKAALVEKARRGESSGFAAGDAFRASFVASTTDEVSKYLAAIADGRTMPGLFVGEGAPGKVAFLFPGQGSQSLEMSGAVAMEFASAREVLDRAADVDAGVVRAMFPPSAYADDVKKAQQAHLTRTENAQPALGVASLAFLRALESLGVTFDMAAGHSFGELTALCAAGAFDEASLVRLARKRGELMAQAASAQAGAMAAVLGDPAKVRATLEGSGVVVANENAPDQTVISGEAAAVDACCARLAALGLTVKKLPVSTAFHSPLVEGACRPLADFLASMTMEAPKRPVFSNGTAAPHGEDVDALRAALARQVRDPVRFVDEIRAMKAAGATVFVEVGPGQVLTGLASRIVPDATCIATDGKDGLRSFYTAVARLCAAGVAVDLARVPATAPSRAPVVTKTSVMVTGSNLGKPPPPAPVAPVRRAAPVPAPAPSPTPAPAPSAPAPAPSAPAPAPPRATAHAAHATPAPAHKKVPMTTQKPPLNASFLDVLREGQRQTADAHIAFQRALTDAHTAYLQAFESTQNTLVAALSGTAAPVVVEKRVTGSVQPSLPPRAADPAPVEQHVEPIAIPPAVVARASSNGHANGNGHAKAVVLPSPAVVIPAVVAKPAGAVDARALLIDVVAEKTGYPKESLEDSMSLEADLGIDSIKRVEILGALKDKLPAAGTLDALQLAQLKTLGEIARALGGVNGAASHGAANGHANGAANGHANGAANGHANGAANGHANGAANGHAHGHANGAANGHANGSNGGVLAALIDVVADKTGYPKDALSPAMTLESDLGVDSIKRVEILSALKDKVPSLPAVDAVKLAQLQTIGEIAGALEGTRPF